MICIGQTGSKGGQQQPFVVRMWPGSRGGFRLLCACIAAWLWVTCAFAEPTTGHEEVGQDMVTLAEDCGKHKAEPGATAICFNGEKISLNFQDTEIRPILQIIANLVDINLVVSDAVSGRITLRLEEVPWDQALDLMLRAKSLTSRRVDNVLIVGTQAEIASQEEMTLQHLQRAEELKPLDTQYLQILHAKAEDIAALLMQRPEGDQRPEGGQGALSARGSAIVDKRTNALILRDTQERIAAMRLMIAKLDISVRQVVIEARLVTANTSFSRQLGVQWGLKNFSRGRVGGRQGTTGKNLPASTNQDAYSSQTLDVNLGISDNQATNFAIGFLGNGFVLDLELSALASEGRGEVVARPKIVTADKQSATIVSGVEIPFQETSTSGATATTFKQAVMSLEVTPRITPDDRVAMDLRVSQDSLGSVVNGMPLINTNRIRTQVLVNNGDTVVLGGIYRVQQIKSVIKVPLLGDIPILRWLFRRTIDTREKQELLIFIMPRIVQDIPAEKS